MRKYVCGEMVKPELTTLEACHRLALIEGQKATGSREMIRIDEGSTVRKESTLRGKPATAGKENKNGRPKREGDSG
jgi:hypothetical protein